MDVFPDRNTGWSKHRMLPYIASRPGEAGFIDLRRQPKRISEVREDYVQVDVVATGGAMTLVKRAWQVAKCDSACIADANQLVK
jgi:hypothetical protein